MKKYLFVCRHNFTRSRHGAEFFEGYLKGKCLNGRVDSAGIGFISYFLGKRVSKKLLEGVDLIFVMENYMKDSLMEKFDVNKNKIRVLGVKDVYGFLKKKSIEDLDNVFKSLDWRRYIGKF